MHGDMHLRYPFDIFINPLGHFICVLFKADHHTQSGMAGFQFWDLTMPLHDATWTSTPFTLTSEGLYAISSHHR